MRTNFLSSKLVRPRDKSFNSLVGFKDSTLFYEFFPYEYSTASKVEAEKLLSKSPTVVQVIRTHNIKSAPASYFFEMLPANNYVFLNVDVEGVDLQVLKSLDFRQNRPDLICVEEWGLTEEGRSPIREFLMNFGYEFVNRTGLSNFYKKT